MADAADPFALARRALDRGEYGQVLALLEPLQESHPPSTSSGAQLQLLLATACMGQGNTERAITCCRQVKRCADPDLRSQARDILAVLEAPALQRPREWSLTLPDLGEAEPLAGRLRQAARSRQRSPAPPAPPPPPVGPTRAPLGFAALVLSLLLLALSLGGCVQVRTELHFGQPGRLQLVEQLSPPPGQPPSPWQRRFATALGRQGLRSVGGTGQQDRLVGPMQPAAPTLALLQSSLEEAGRLTGIRLPAAVTEWQERNWLLGVRQRLALELDLRPAAPVPGLEVSVDLRPMRARAVHRAEPEPIQPQPQRGSVLRWPLRLGAVNRLEIICWRWSALGLGAIAISIGLCLVLTLSTVRHRLGFGWPELPA